MSVTLRRKMVPLSISFPWNLILQQVLLNLFISYSCHLVTTRSLLSNLKNPQINLYNGTTSPCLLSTSIIKSISSTLFSCGRLNNSDAILVNILCILYSFLITFSLCGDQTNAAYSSFGSCYVLIFSPSYPNPCNEMTF